MYTILVLVLLIIFITMLTLCIIIRYMDKRDKGDLHLKIKFLSFEFVIDTSSEKLIKKSNNKKGSN